MKSVVIFAEFTANRTGNTRPIHLDRVTARQDPALPREMLDCERKRKPCNRPDLPHLSIFIGSVWHKSRKFYSFPEGVFFGNETLDFIG
jgi:hypothetical protein